MPPLASFMTRSTSGPPNGSRRDARQSAADLRVSPSCFRRAITITRLRLPDARSNVNASAPERKASTPHRRADFTRSEEHTSELQSQFHLVCRLLLEKKNQKRYQ